MKYFKIPLALLIATTTFFSFTTYRKASEEFKIGQKAPMVDVQMLNTDNSMLSLEKLKQQNGLLIVFSCNTCPFVVGNENFPGWERQYNELHKAAEKAGIGMTLVNSNEGKRANDDAFKAMQEHAAGKAYTMPYLVDQNAALANAFGAKTTPHVYLLDKDFKLIYQGAIDNTWDPKRKEDISYLVNAIANVSAGENVKENTTAPKGCSIKRVAN